MNFHEGFLKLIVVNVWCRKALLSALCVCNLWKRLAFSFISLTDMWSLSSCLGSDVLLKIQWFTEGVLQNIYIYIFGWGCFDSDIVSPVLLCFHANNGELNRNKNRNHRLWGSCFTSAWKIWDQTRSCLVFFWSESESLNFSWSTTCSFMCETLTALGVHEIKTS